MKNSLLVLLFMVSGCLPASAAKDSLRFSIYYETAQYTITRQHEDSLKAWFTDLESKFTLHHIMVLSYCDDVGTDFYNDSLSTKRAQHAWQALKPFSFGDKTMMWVQGMGEVVLNLREDEESQRSHNRRTDFWVYYEPKKKEPQLQEMKVGEKLTLANILFTPGTRRLLPESKPALDSLFLALQQNPEVKVRILGYVCCLPINTDGPDIETGEENLSVMRAQAVYDYLIEKGIDPNRLTYAGLGSQPTGYGAKQDRRVEIEVTERSKP